MATNTAIVNEALNVIQAAGEQRGIVGPPQLLGVAVHKPASLYDIEENLLALLDTEAMVSADDEAAFERDLAEQLQKAVVKRDRVASFIKHCEAQADFAAKEIQRIQARKRTFENVADRMRDYVTRVIESLGLDLKGKPKKLEGESFTLSVRSCPVSVDIAEPEKVPDRFKTVTVSMPVSDYLMLLSVVPNPEMRKRVDATAAYSVDCAAVKKELEAGAEVPGADLIVGKHTLQIR